MMLTILFAVILVAGLVVVVLGFYGLSRSFTPGSQTQADVSAQVARLIPISIGIGAAVFGIVGLLILYLTDMGSGPSVIWALGAGLLVGFAVQAVLYYRLLRHAATQPPPPDPSLGLVAEVVITSPGNGIGQIAYQSDGQTFQIGASSATFEKIPVGSTVRIESITRRVAIVRPVSRNGSVS
ncbi:MAG: hypothetical protein R3C44_00760 [Chloroflexota bacterium]